MHDWMKVDTFNRLTHFKILIIKCLQIESLQLQFVENNIFQSDIFRLLPLEFQQNLKKFIINTKSLLVCIDRIDGLVQFYNPKQKSWHTSPVSLQLPNEQKYFQLALFGSMLYAFGGEDGDENALNQMWSRDLSDPSSQWTAKADMKQSRELFCSVVLNDTIYALGGVDTNDHLLLSCERYSSQLNEWSTVANMNIERIDASAAVINGCIYVAGERNKEGVLKSVSKYCPETDTWREVAPMTTGRYSFALTPFDGRLWAIGGVDGDHHQLSSCESYDPVTDTWREEAPMKEGRWGHAAIEFNGELYVVGGSKSAGRKYNGKVFYKQTFDKYFLVFKPTGVEKYVPKVDEWVEDSTLQETNIIPYLLNISPAYSSYFTTDEPEPAVHNNKKSSCKVN